MMSTRYSQDAIERRRLLNRAAQALADGRLDQEKYRRLKAKHEAKAAPPGYGETTTEFLEKQPLARKVQRQLY